MRAALTLILLCLEASVAFADSAHSDRLKAAGRLGVPYDDCLAVENRLGQLLYVNADGFGEGGHAVHPDYVRLTSELGLGGVLPHFGTKDPWEIRRAALALRAATTAPLLLGVDYVDVALDGRDTRIGLGWGGGVLGAYGGKLEGACVEQAAYLQGFLHRALGLNHALGPTVDGGRRSAKTAPADTETSALSFLGGLRLFGVAPTLKHFPYLPEGFDLHETSKDEENPREKVKSKTAVFTNLSGKTDFVMSTHLINPKIDPELVTFSKEWIRQLREEAGFNGLIMTDALLMIARYKSLWPSIVKTWGREEKIHPREGVSIYAARALLAGHDMIVLEGTAANTRRVFADLHYVGCQDTANGKALRVRIAESFSRVTAYKERKRAELTRQLDAPEALVREAFELYAGFSSKNDKDPALGERAAAACGRQRESFAAFRERARAYETPDADPR